MGPSTTIYKATPGSFTAAVAQVDHHSRPNLTALSRTGLRLVKVNKEGNCQSSSQVIYLSALDGCGILLVSSHLIYLNLSTPFRSKHVCTLVKLHPMYLEKEGNLVKPDIALPHRTPHLLISNLHFITFSKQTISVFFALAVLCCFCRGNAAVTVRPARPVRP